MAVAGLLRCGKSCRLRWINYLRPDVKRGNFSSEEEKAIIELHQRLGNRWSAIASRLPGRTDNEIKNIWNTHLKKRLLRMGIDPVTHLSVPQAKSLVDYSEYSRATGPLIDKDNLALVKEISSVDSPTKVSNFPDTFYDSQNLSSEILSSMSTVDSEVICGDSSSSSLDCLQSSCINSFEEPVGYTQQAPAIEDETFLFENQDLATEICRYEVLWEQGSNGNAQYFKSEYPEDDFLSTIDDEYTDPHLLKNIGSQTNDDDDSDGTSYWLKVLSQAGSSPILL